MASTMEELTTVPASTTAPTMEEPEGIVATETAGGNKKIEIEAGGGVTITVNASNTGVGVVSGGTGGDAGADGGIINTADGNTTSA